MAGFLISEIAGWSRGHCHLVSLHDFPSGLLLAATAALSLSWPPFVISLLGCSWLPLPPCFPACLPSWAPSGLLLAVAVAMISLLGCSWRSLPPCPFMISILGCSWLPLPPCFPACLPSWAPSGLLLAVAVAMISLLGCSWRSLPPCPFMISILGCSWLPCLPVCVPEMLSGVYAGVIFIKHMMLMFSPCFFSSKDWIPRNANTIGVGTLGLCLTNLLLLESLIEPNLEAATGAQFEFIALARIHEYMGVPQEKDMRTVQGNRESLAFNRPSNCWWNYLWKATRKLVTPDCGVVTSIHR